MTNSYRKTSMIETRGQTPSSSPLPKTRPTCLNNIPLSNESRIHSHIHTRIQASHGKAELSKSVIKTDDNGKWFRQIRVLMVPNLQKWWNIEEKFLWPNRDSNPGTLKWESDALWPTPSEPHEDNFVMNEKKFHCD
jgi:hypothetical protein